MMPFSEFYTLEQQLDGGYTLETHVSNGGESYFFGSNLYMDSGRTNIYFEDAGNGLYNIYLKDGEGNPSYLGCGDPAPY